MCFTIRVQGLWLPYYFPLLVTSLRPKGKKLLFLVNTCLVCMSETEESITLFTTYFYYWPNIFVFYSAVNDAFPYESPRMSCRLIKTELMSPDFVVKLLDPGKDFGRQHRHPAFCHSQAGMKTVMVRKERIKKI